MVVEYNCIQKYLDLSKAEQYFSITYYDLRHILLYYINTNEILRELSRENIMLFSHVKGSPLLWIHHKSRLSQLKTILSEMVWSFLNGLVLKNISLVRCDLSWNKFQHSKRNFVSPRGHVISYLCFFLTPPALYK